MVLVGRILRLVSARLHSVWGFTAFRLGWAASARRSFERVLALRGDDFSAYVHLGRISFAAGDYAAWRREFEHARRTDARRFAKLGQSFEAFEPRFAGTDFDDTGERATWRSLRPLGAAGGRHPQRPDVPADTGQDASLPGWDPGMDAVADAAAPRIVSNSVSGERAGAGPRDDCTSATERLRLRQLGPIRAHDVATCDVDELARRLSG